MHTSDAGTWYRTLPILNDLGSREGGAKLWVAEPNDEWVYFGREDRTCGEHLQQIRVTA